MRSCSMSPVDCHSIPESSSPIETSGRPSVTSNAVRIGVPAAMHEPVPEGIVACASTRLMPVTPHSSSCWELFCVTATLPAGSDSFEGGVAGVPANFHPSPPTLLGVWPGWSAQVDGSDAVPSPM